MESGAAAHGGALVELRELTIRAGGRALLERTTARFEPHQVTLIIGPSGAGKSLLLRVIAGLLDGGYAEVDVAGSVRIGGVETLGRRRREPTVGVVFQQFALFDELSPLRNLRFARAHRSPAAAPLDSEALLDELGVPRHLPVGRLSGGQQQRLAIARTLAADPAVVLYDEPTSGLDAATAEQVATLIQRTHRTHPKTAIVVTHDYESLAWIADRVYLLDAAARSLRPIDPADWPRLREQLAPAAGPAAAPAATRAVALPLHRLGDLLAGTTAVCEAAVQAPFRLLPLWRSPLWGLHALAHQLRLVAGPSAWLYLAVTGVILGFVVTHFAFEYLPYADYTEPLVEEEVLGSVGFALYRILIPLVGTILIAARCGAAVASDLGNKTYGRQLDAMRSLGAAPRRYLQTNVLWAFLLGAPLLIAMAFLSGRFASLLAFTIDHPERGPRFWRQHFHAELLLPGAPFYAGTGWLVSKVLACAIGTALIAWHQGVRAKPAATAVSDGVTATILWATLWVLVVHFGFAFFEFEAAG